MAFSNLRASSSVKPVYLLPDLVQYDAMYSEQFLNFAIPDQGLILINLNVASIYLYKYRFFPTSHKLIGQLEDDVWDKNPKFTYEEMQIGVKNELIKMIGELKTQREKPFKINNGDWVTTSKEYAKMHGESNLNNNYRILTKVVKASQLYTDGNSIFEWGYVA